MYGLGEGANVTVSDITFDQQQTSFILHYYGKPHQIQVPLIGEFNVLNVMAAVSVALKLGATWEKITAALKTFPALPGRQEQYVIDDVHYYIDFAHTPNGLESILEYLKNRKGSGRLICVFGAPGMRDKGKRPEMGSVVERLADDIIITDDDAAQENRREIISQIMKGI